MGVVVGVAPLAPPPATLAAAEGEEDAAPEGIPATLDHGGRGARSDMS